MNEQNSSVAPRFSIVTITFNAEQTIIRTLDSVTAQNYANVEHILIDGASTDGTLPLLRRYQERNAHADVPHQIKLLSEPDSGLYEAMNKAFDLATGHYICFLNAGDTLHSANTLALLAAAFPFATTAPQNFPAVLYGLTNIVDNAGKFLHPRRLAPPEQLTWRDFRNGMLVCHQAFYARRDLCTPYNLRYRYSADYDWCIRLMRRATDLHLPLLNTHLVLADYLCEGTTTRHHRASLLERLRIMAHHYGWPTAIAQHAWFVVRTIFRGKRKRTNN